VKPYSSIMIGRDAFSCFLIGSDGKLFESSDGKPFESSDWKPFESSDWKPFESSE
jgi:hypothetical protein